MASPGWLLTLSDCMLLLLTFFVMLFAMSSVKNERWRDFSASLASALRPVTALDPRALPAPAARPTAFAGTRDVDYLAGLLAGVVARQPALAGYRLERTPEGLSIRPTLLLWQEVGGAPLSPRIGPLGQAALALLADRLRLVENTLVVRVRAPLDGDRGADPWTEAMARGVALAEGLRAAGIGRDIPVMGFLAADADDAGIDLLLRPPRAGGL
ncbi:MAG: flagellar motor protein MotB [Alphaproteobacteria bacterium]|nr:flagellar motor protein MotB [Alphaproteobacteria bacterium]